MLYWIIYRGSYGKVFLSFGDGLVSYRVLPLITKGDDVFRNFVLLALMLSLSSCFSSYFYYAQAERLYIWSALDGEKKTDVENFDLVYLFGVDTASDLTFAYYRNSHLEWHDDEWHDDVHIKCFFQVYCNTILASSLDGCDNTLRGLVNVKIYLRDKQNGSSYLLDQKTVDMNAYRRSFLITQVYIGSNFERYETRPRYNIDWNKMKPLVLNGGNDTIYHYTVKYWEKRATNGDYVNNFPDKKYFVDTTKNRSFM